MSFHLFHINELYSNANGAIQFIELTIGNINGESFWQGQSIDVIQGNAVHSFRFTTNLPNPNTANKSVLIATQGFAESPYVTFGPGMACTIHWGPGEGDCADGTIRNSHNRVSNHKTLRQPPEMPIFRQTPPACVTASSPALSPA